MHWADVGLPAPVRDILGDALWAMMIAWLVVTAIPKDSRGVRAAVGAV